MVSLWGSKKDNGLGEDEESSARNDNTGESQPSHTTASHSHEPTERTRLLASPPGGYLDPDDPAVSVLPTNISP